MRKLIGFWLFISATVIAGTNDVSVSLHLPCSQILLFEKEPITITVTNGSAMAVPFLRDINHALRRQLWFDFGDDNQMSDIPQKFALTEAKRQWLLEMPVSWPATMMLHPGEQYTWVLSAVDMVVVNDFVAAHSTSNITAYVKLGTNNIVCSKTLSFNVVNAEISNKFIFGGEPVVQDVEYFNKHCGRLEKSALFMVPLGKKEYIFNSQGERLIELPDGEYPVFETNAKSRTISVSFSKSNKHVRYSLQTLKVEPDENAK